MKNYLSNTRFIYNHLKETASGWVFGTIFFQFLNSIFPFVVIYCIRLLIDSLQDYNSGGISELYWLVLYVAVAFLLQHTVRIASDWASLNLAERTKDHILQKIQVKATSLDISYFEDPDFHDLMRRISSETPQRASTIITNLSRILQNVLAALILIVWLVTVHWLVLPSIIIVFIPAIFIRYFYAKKIYHWKKDNDENSRMYLYLNRILTTPSFAKEVRLFNLVETIATRFKALASKLRNEKLSIINRRALANILSISTIVGAMFFFLAYMVNMTVKGDYTIGQLVMYFMFIRIGFGFLNAILNSLNKYVEDQLFIDSFHDFMVLKPRMKSIDTTVASPIILNQEIRFKNVWFKYPKENSPWVLKDLSLSIPKGKTVALVGENGAGKSTIVKLLCRLYDVSQGEITLDQNEYTTVSPEALRDQISVVFQDYVLYNMSIKDNIRFGDIEKKLSNENIREAAIKSGIEPVIDKLPEKYDTVLGVLFKNSRELSLGEWQKIAISRAFYKDSPIIILDEPTSALDARAEYFVFNKFYELTKGKTAVIISHRFSTVKMADLIYVLENGAVAEKGTHSELMELNGKYAAMFNLQADNYKI